MMSDNDDNNDHHKSIIVTCYTKTRPVSLFFVLRKMKKTKKI